MKYPLWGDPTSETSSLFVVHPGKCVLLVAVGLEEYATQTDASFKTAQMVCVERVIHEFMPGAWKPVSCDCDWVFCPDRPLAKEVSSEAVSVAGCHWTLSQCDNVGIVGLPGTYRLRLNDPTATDHIQVYAELFDASQIPVQMTNIFFQ